MITMRCLYLYLSYSSSQVCLQFMSYWQLYSIRDLLWQDYHQTSMISYSDSEACWFAPLIAYSHPGKSFDSFRSLQEHRRILLIYCSAIVFHFSYPRFLACNHHAYGCAHFLETVREMSFELVYHLTQKCSVFAVEVTIHNQVWCFSFNRASQAFAAPWLSIDAADWLMRVDGPHFYAC